jgi:hypothetical protein
MLFFIPPIGFILLLAGILVAVLEAINKLGNKQQSPRQVIETELLRVTDPQQQQVLQTRLEGIRQQEGRTLLVKIVAAIVIGVLVLAALSHGGSGSNSKPTEKSGTELPASENPPTPTPVLLATPTPEADSMTQASSTEFIETLNGWLDNHDWQSLTQRTVSGKVNYFGHRHCSNVFIEQDMLQDAKNYVSVKSTIYPDTFTRTVGSDGITYDEINIESEAIERTGRRHHALTRLTVGYTSENGETKIYALVLKVLADHSKKAEPVATPSLTVSALARTHHHQADTESTSQQTDTAGALR